MKTSLIPFSFHSNEVRAFEREGEIWFVAKDICSILEIDNPTMAIRSLDDDESTLSTIEGSHRPTNIINESGLYNLIFRSRKESAKAFRKWVTSEVLPAIRKTGSYQAKATSPLDQLKVDTEYLKDCIDFLNPDDPTKISLLRKFGEDRGMNMNYLPEYKEYSKAHRSISDLLKAHGSTLTAAKANNKLIELGYLSLETRLSKTKGQKTYKAITQKGSRYGINLSTDRNPNEVQPRWYEETFPELLRILGGDA